MAEFAAKRRHPRVALQVTVDVSTIDPQTDRRTGRPYFLNSQERCGNLSSGGMFLATPEPPSPGHRLLVRIHAPDGVAIETVARVAWRSLESRGAERGAGIEFVGPSAAARAALKRILNAAPATGGDG